MFYTYILIFIDGTQLLQSRFHLIVNLIAIKNRHFYFELGIYYLDTIKKYKKFEKKDVIEYTFNNI